MLKPLALIVLGLISLPSIALEKIAQHKKVIGPTALYSINEQAEFKARIDTGAATTSIHAVDIEIEDEVEDMQGNIGKTVHFPVENADKKQWRITSKISKVKQVRNSQGIEKRYLVPLRLGWDSINKTVDVNLRDRSKMQYKLLIGRDWMAKEVVVDLERQEEE